MPLISYRTVNHLGNTANARKMRARWNIERLIAVFGGIEPMREAHAALGFPPIAYKGVNAWKRRQSIPADRVAELLVVLRERGELDVWDFIIVDKK